MDDRQQQIRERAGLEESRLNQEFIDWLRKWGTPILFVAALAAAGFALKQRMEKSHAEKVDNAFIDLDNASQGENPSPDSLTRVANDYEGVKSVSLLARLDAADAYLSAVQRGVKFGATLKTNDKGQQDGTLESADQALTPEDRTTYLSSAGELYQAVYDKASNDAGKKLLTLSAMYGLAAVAEGQSTFDAAKDWYQKIESLTDKTPYAAHAELAKARIAKLDELAKVTPPLALAELPKRPEPPAPPKPVVTPAPAPGPAPVADPTTTTPTTTPTTPPAPAATPENAPGSAPATQPATTPPTSTPEPAKAPEPAPATPK